MKKVSSKRILLLFYLFFATTALILFNNLAIFLIINVGLLVLLGVLTKWDLLNPVLIFTAFFSLYQLSYPILNRIGVKVFEYAQMNPNYYIYSWVATASLIIFFGNVKSIRYDKEKLKNNTEATILYAIYIILIAISITASVYIITRGYATKYELRNANDPIILIGQMTYTTLIAYPLYIFLNDGIKKKTKIKIILLNLCIIFLGVATYGERSYLFNYILILLLTYATFRKINFKKLLIIIIPVVIGVALSTNLKMSLVNNNYNGTAKIENENAITLFLNSDFSSAGFNFNYLLNSDSGGIMNGMSYIYDILSPLEDILPIKKYNASNWYTEKYWSKRKTGLGFTMIGEGYVNFGIIGIIIEMLVVSIILRFLYKHSTNNTYSYIIYLGAISLAIYSSRQTIGSIISPLIKYYVLIAILIYLINKKITNKKRI